MDTNKQQPGTVEVIDHNAKETAAAIRKALRQEFPGVKFSVRMATGSAHGWVDVRWTDGPRPKQVRAITSQFQNAKFDGMDDAYHGIEPTLYAREDGTLYEQRWTCRGVTHSRTESPEATAWAESVAVAGSRWWIDTEAPFMYEPAYYAARKLLDGTDLSNGYPDNPAAAYRERWED